jgi:hypothetical protein
MQAELYADAIGEITVSGSIVRVDLVSLSATQRDASGKPVPEFRQRVVMSLEGFANSFDVIQKAMNGLAESGAIRRTTTETNDPAPAAPAQAARAAKGEVHLNGSPNFA